MNANIRRLAFVFVIIFGLISVDLVYWQVIDAGSLNANVGNIRNYYTSSRVLRGRIYDRNGILLVGRLVHRGGFVQPLYYDPSLAQTIGYHSIQYLDSGLEASLDPYLRGSQGTSLTQTYNSWLHRPVTGDNVYLTIDERVQQAAVNAINASLAANGLPTSTPAAAIAFNPQNGQVLAMVSKPYYNATCLDSSDQRQEAACLANIETVQGALVNRVTNGIYPPGSTFKTFTLSAAIDAGVQSLSTVYSGIKATGPITIDGFTLPSSTNNLICGDTSVSVLRAFMESDNIVFAQIGQSLGRSRFLSYAHRFQIGSRIPFDLHVRPSEIIVPGERFDPVALATSAFGQGSDSVTPMQMALIAGTIADGGRMPKPTLVQAVKTPDNTQVAGDTPGTIANSVVSSGTTAQVRHAMVQVVEGQCGSGYEAQIPGVLVAGKTGTAQNASGNPDAWFISFAPARHPTVATAVVVEGGGEGYNVAAPISRQIMQAALQYGE
ncbi:MAG TPA: penicillin-binding protein 2 [Chloroflexota bacterium]|nr:penicillin-binding protein 2 [Chloroflexota bacterium]